MIAMQAQRAAQSASKQYVVFRLGDTRFGVDIRQVVRIVRLTPITRVPQAPRFLSGIISYRGQVVPVVDLHLRLALPGVEYDDTARILIVELDSQPVGMLVDSVVGISHIPVESIQEPPEMVAEVNGVYLTGVVHHEGRLIVLLDLARILTVEEVAETFASVAQVTTRVEAQGID